jgi:phosphoribosylcarboxyaminoimidazole (NCAIR) mutase
MPGGIPVATMSIGKPGARNAAIFAAQILSLKYPAIRKKIISFKKDMELQVEAKARELEKKLR